MQFALLCHDLLIVFDVSKCFVHLSCFWGSFSKIFLMYIRELKIVKSDICSKYCDLLLSLLWVKVSWTI